MTLSFNKSFLLLSKQTLGILSPKQKIDAFRSFMMSMLLAILEVISVTSIIPVFYYLMNKPDTNIQPFPDTLPAITISWSLIIAALIVIFISKNLLAVWINQKQLNFSNDLYLTFAERLYNSFYHQPWQSYLTENSAESFRKIKNIAFEFTNNVLLNYFSLFSDILICTLSTGILLWIDYRIIFVLLALGLPLLLYYYHFRKNVVSKLDRSFRELTPQASVILTQGIDSYAEARVYHKEDFFINRFIEISKISTRLLSDLKIIVSLPSRMLETISILCVAAMIVYAKLYPSAQQSLLLFAGLIFLAMYRIIPSLNRIMISLSQIQAYAYTVIELQKNFGRVVQPSSDQKQKIFFERKIELRNISFEYVNGSKNYILRDLNLILLKGQLVVIEGDSGSGKSTLLHLLAGLITEYQGQLVIDDTILSGSTLPSWQSKLSIVPQAPIVLQDTVLHNIAFGVEDHCIETERVEKSIELAGLTNFVSMLPLYLDTPIGENGLTLSGGQRQRLILARALYRNTEVLLLDEVTNQLDEENKMRVLVNLQLLAKQGKTILLISHDPMVKKFADHALHMKNLMVKSPASSNQSPPNTISLGLR